MPRAPADTDVSGGIILGDLNLYAVLEPPPWLRDDGLTILSAAASAVSLLPTCSGFACQPTKRSRIRRARYARGRSCLIQIEAKGRALRMHAPVAVSRCLIVPHAATSPARFRGRCVARYEHEPAPAIAAGVRVRGHRSSCSHAIEGAVAVLNLESPHLQDDAPWRQGPSDEADRPTLVSSRCATDIRDEAGRRYLSTLLQESALWLAIVRRDQPPGWSEQAQRSHELTLSQLRDVFADRSAGSHACGAARAWLMGHCRTMREQHDGARASDVLRRCRTDADAEGADQRANRSGLVPLDSTSVAST